MKSACVQIVIRLLLLCTLLGANAMGVPVQKDFGYRGIWYSIGQENGDGIPKYSGGLGTYTAKHTPLAHYCEEVEKTFFVWGGGRADNNRDLMIMISYYDHASGNVPRPSIIRDGEGMGDAHANPSVTVDKDGYIYVVSATRHSFEGRIYRSSEPYSIEDFEVVHTGYMAYPQPWYSPDQGFILCYIRYTGGECSTG